MVRADSRHSKMGWTLGCVLAGLVAAPASAAFITFDELPTNGSLGSAPADTYAHEGVFFGSTFHISNVALLDSSIVPKFTALGGTMSNTLILASIVNQFTATISLGNTTTDWVEVTVIDTNVGTTAGLLEAFDADGVLLGSASLVTPPSLGGRLRVEAEGIAGFRLTSDADGALFDNIAYSVASVAAVPAPSAAALLGLAGLGSRRRRR